MQERARTADVVLLGSGGAGTAVLHQLALALAGPSPARGAARNDVRGDLRGGGGGPVRVVVVDPLDRLAERPADRTWCSWVERGSTAETDLAPAVHRAWDAVHVVAPDGADLPLDLGPLRYAMVRGEDYYAHVADLVERARERGVLEVEHLPTTAEGVREDGAGAVVATGAGEVRAPLVLDSRPAPPVRPATSALVQHFLGQRVAVAGGGVDPGRAVLMDFAVPQPPTGLAFGYCLPTDASTALVEHTAFVPELLDGRAQAAELAAYRERVLGTAEGVVEHSETGAIPMTDAVFTRRAAPPPGLVRSRVLRLGTAGGAVRPSTGYAFSALQRDARALARQVVGGVPGDRVELGRPYPRRHAWMDALVLRALLAGADGGGLDGPDFFVRLFRRNPPERVLRFLDGLTGPREELALMATSPRGPMLRAAAADAASRAVRLADRSGRSAR